MGCLEERRWVGGGIHQKKKNADLGRGGLAAAASLLLLVSFGKGRARTRACYRCCV
jgi:hypothetical protein